MSEIENQEQKIVGILKEYYPELDSGPGTPFFELVIRPMAFLWTKHEQGIQELLASNVLENYRAMPEEDMDRLMTRYFIERKRGSQVAATIRLLFNDNIDYLIPKDTLFDLGSGKIYRTVTDYIAPINTLPGNITDGYYLDVSVVSDGIGSEYNVYANTSIDPSMIYGGFSAYLRAAYFVEDSTDGGITETNIQLYYRAKNSLSLRNMTTYRGVRATLFEAFNAKEVVPIGLRDPEQRRDLVELPDVGIVHRGGMADIYVNLDPYSIGVGYLKPLGFPYSYRGISMTVDPDGVMNSWNGNTSFVDVDTTTRGSMDEVIVGLSEQTTMETLTSNILPVHDFVRSSDYEAIHSDNLVKQMWPVVLCITVNISDTLGELSVATAKDAIYNYVMQLRDSAYPKVSNIVHALKSAGITAVHLPMVVNGYYLTEQLQMEKIGLNKYNSASPALMTLLDVDSLRFIVDTPSQVSPRTVMWYTNRDLITVTVV